MADFDKKMSILDNTFGQKKAAASLPGKYLCSQPVQPSRLTTITVFSQQESSDLSPSDRVSNIFL